jgi:hypothetical protein
MLAAECVGRQTTKVIQPDTARLRGKWPPHAQFKHSTIELPA